MEFKSKKHIIILSVLILFLALGIIELTYAFFSVQVSENKEVNAIVQTGDVDELSFEIDNNIDIEADLNNFAYGMSNLSSEMIASAILKANINTNSATSNYNIYFSIMKNEFVYSSTDEKAELILQVYAPGSDDLYQIEDLTPVTTGTGENEITGYDITTANGLITIANNYEIISNNEPENRKRHDWRIVVTFVNLESDQSINIGKEFKAKTIISATNSTIPEACQNQNLAQCISNNYLLDDSLYFHTQSLENSANDYSVRYAGEDFKLADGYDVLYSSIYDLNEESNGLIKFYCSRGTDYSYVGKSCESPAYDSYYYIVEDPNIHYNNLYEAFNYAVTNRYLESNIKNYVCFGSDETICPEDNLYRIIGVFPDYDNQEILRIKLVKDDYIGTDIIGTTYATGTSISTSDNRYYRGTINNISYYYWSGKNDNISNTWSSSTLNTVGLNINYINYLNSINTKWSSMITETKWKIGGSDFNKVAANGIGARNTYLNEINKSGIYAQVPPTDNMNEDTFKIGLMYVSDFLLAASPDKWSLQGQDTLEENDYRSARESSWLYQGQNEWFITRDSEYNNKVYCIENGFINTTIPNTDLITLRPTFYLDQNIKLIRGYGTKINPFRIGIES